MSTPNALYAPTSVQAQASGDRDYKWAAALVLMVIFEGSFGKWLSPALEYPPVFLRDGIGLVIIYRALTSARLRQHGNLYAALLAWSVLATVFAFVQAFVLGQGMPIVLIGIRFWVLYLWVALALCSTLNWQDYRRLSSLIATALLCMLPLLLVQNQAGAEAWINKSSSEDAQIFIVAGDVVRTTGTFSFTLGFTCFLALATPLLLTRHEYNPVTTRGWMQGPVVAFAAIVLCAVVSGSRGAIGFAAITLGCAVFAGLVFGARNAWLNLLGGGMAVVAVLLVPVLLPETNYALQDRFTSAYASEDPIERIVATLIGTSEAWNRFSLLGEGLGLSANMSARFAGTQAGQFVLAEVEAERVVLAGGLLGLLFIVFKLGLLAVSLVLVLRTCANHRVVGPLLLWVCCAAALTTWPMSGQLSAHVMGSLLLALTGMSVGIFDRTRN